MFESTDPLFRRFARLTVENQDWKRRCPSHPSFGDRGPVIPVPYPSILHQCGGRNDAAFGSNWFRRAPNSSRSFTLMVHLKLRREGSESARLRAKLWEQCRRDSRATQPGRTADANTCDP